MGSLLLSLLVKSLLGILVKTRLIKEGALRMPGTASLSVPAHDHLDFQIRVPK
jgi:hypothetical protein